MSHAHVSNTGRIWKVFWLLSAITIVEVFFGIYKPQALFLTDFLSMNLLNWLFIILTLVKAYYIGLLCIWKEKRQLCDGWL
jgi:cytochrome c oxidase subunit 4